MSVEFKDMESNAKEAVALLKAMANSHRLMTLCALAEGELSVTALNEIIPVAQSSLSQHLAWLRREGLVTTRRESQTIYYKLASVEVREIIATLHKLYCQ